MKVYSVYFKVLVQGSSVFKIYLIKTASGKNLSIICKYTYVTGGQKGLTKVYFSFRRNLAC